jgi:hypothetical protein
MNEHEKITLRQVQKTWQAKQSHCGKTTMALCAATFGGFLYFLSAPSSQSAGILALLMVMLAAACARMISCAAKVVAIRNVLQPVRVQANAIDAKPVRSTVNHYC